MAEQLLVSARNTVAGLVEDGVTVLNGEDATNAGTPLANLQFVYELSTAPRALQRLAFGLVAQLVVPPGTCAVAHLAGGEQQVFTPGSHTILGYKPGSVLVQWVDVRRRQVQVGPVEGMSADKWRVRLWLTIDVAVADAALISAHREPLSALAAATNAGALAFIEQHTHAALTGRDGMAGGVDAPAQALLERLRADPSAEGLQIISVRIAERQGDERQAEAAMSATVAAAQIDEDQRVAAARNRARMAEITAQRELTDHEHGLRMAVSAAEAREALLQTQSDVQRAVLTARQEIALAQIRAQTAEIAREEQQWQADQVRLQGEWERVQQEFSETHRTDQHLRLLDAQHGLLRVEGETALVVSDRQQTHELALAEIQQRIAAQRAAQSEAIAERRAAHDRTLLELHLRHEQLVAEQFKQLEQWRVSERSNDRLEQHRHDRQIAAIAGAAQIAAAAATPALPEDTSLREAVSAGLQVLQDLVS